MGRVLSAEPHPDADRLQVCNVDLGVDAERPATIVCGAPNVGGGQTVAVARPGAVMPDGSTLAGEAAGVLSEGMIPVQSELEIGAGGEGILGSTNSQLDAELAPGTPLEQVLPIATEVLELEIPPTAPTASACTASRVSCTPRPARRWRGAPWEQDPGSRGPLGRAQVTVECPDLCPRFTARVFEDVTIAPSPPWLKARLTAPGSARSTTSSTSPTTRCCSPASRCTPSTSTAWRAGG